MMVEKSEEQLVQKAYSSLLRFMRENKDTSPDTWKSAIWFLIADFYFDNGLPYQDFCDDIELIKLYYAGREKNER